MIKKQFILEGLDCASCSMKIEDRISKIEGTKDVTLNFVNKTLSVSLIEENSKNIESNIISIVKELEPDVKVVPKNKPARKPQIKKPVRVVNGSSKVNDSYNITLLLEGLDCASCAGKIENQVVNLKGINDSSLDFVSKKLRVKLSEGSGNENIIKDIEDIVYRLEPEVKVINISNNPRNKVSKKKETFKEETEDNSEIMKFAVGSAFFVAALVLKNMYWLSTTFFFISYILVGGDVLLKAAKNIVRGQVFDENFLMSIATLGAFAIKEYPEAVAVMIFYKVGELFQSMAVNRSRKSISDLMDIRPDYAVVIRNNKEIKVSPDDVYKEEIIIVKPGEKVPLDGKVIEGNAQLDTSALTGESLPRDIKEGDDILGGFINKNGILKIRVTKEFGESTISKILDLVENASAKKAPTEKFISKFARYYTPVVVICAIMLAFLPPIILGDGSFDQWIYRALVFLVVSCPCALVVSIPLGFFGGIGAASKNGILIKGGNYLEALKNVEAVVFDKTGTLTKGVFKVTKISNEDWISEKELLEYAAYTESYSNHPIATSIVAEFGKNIEKDKVSAFYEHSGLGIEAIMNGKKILAGNNKLMSKEEVIYKEVEEPGTVIHIAVNGIYGGYILISDEIKEDSKEAVKNLKSLGVKDTIMLTGDSSRVAKIVSESLGLTRFYAELLPQHKVEKLEEIDSRKSKEGKIAFVGDGINDAPVLARADVGIAMGGIGSDAAIEAADVVIMTDEPSKIAKAITIARKTSNIVWQNIIFSLGVKAVILIFGALGYATMWEAVFGDVGVTLIAVLNSMRVLRIK
ncbi:heavy metal translocating P-type ATPase [Clostridium sp.]|uniref:heavy metal translocating P-type ATPase n=1 Tax=Clostridium sp. TaxID=1506 RepID=UPI003464E59E